MLDKGKILRNVINRLRASGRTWQEIANELGLRNPGHPYMIATGRWKPSEERAQKILATMPQELLWKGPVELDLLVLVFLSEQERLTGRQLGRLCGTTDRTIRKSVSRLREAGHKIDASLKPPRGYRLDEYATNA